MMQPKYNNWMPRKILVMAIAATIVSFLLTSVILYYDFVSKYAFGTAILVLAIIALIGFGGFTTWCIRAYRAFSYNGERQLSRCIVEGIADYVDMPDGGKGLDIGCGSGALTIACAKRNSKLKMLGIDYWSKEYDSYNQQLCEYNAKAEGVSNISFEKGNAIKLDFDDETFDLVTSNYVYHNISGHNKQDLLKESLRVLKKGGTFALHDIMSKRRYGDINAFVEELKSSGYQKVELIDTSRGLIMSEKEAKSLHLIDSMLLLGVK